MPPNTLGNATKLFLGLKKLVGIYVSYFRKEKESTQYHSNQLDIWLRLTALTWTFLQYITKIIESKTSNPIFATQRFLSGETSIRINDIKAPINKYDTTKTQRQIETCVDLSGYCKCTGQVKISREFLTEEKRQSIRNHQINN